MTREEFNKHKELIEAWVAGAEVEFLDTEEGWTFTKNPSWFEDTEYRIKPQEPKKKTIVLETWLLVSDDDEFYTFECSQNYPIHSSIKVKLLSTREVEKDED